MGKGHIKSLSDGKTKKRQSPGRKRDVFPEPILPSVAAYPTGLQPIELEKRQGLSIVPSRDLDAVTPSL
jgi:hypothetical protein